MSSLSLEVAKCRCFLDEMGRENVSTNGEAGWEDSRLPISYLDPVTQQRAFGWC